MDADIVRLILFLAGIALILGIYLWDRHKKNDFRIHAVKKVPPEDPQVAARQKKQKERKEPIWGENAAEAEEDNLNRELERLGELVQEQMSLAG